MVIHMNKEKIVAVVDRCRHIGSLIKDDVLERAKHILELVNLSGVRHFKRWPVVLVSCLSLMAIYAVSKAQDKAEQRVTHVHETEFKKSRVLGDPYAESNHAKEQMLAKAAKDYADSQQATADALAQVNARLDELATRIAERPVEPGAPDAGQPPATDPSYGGAGLTAKAAAFPSGPVIGADVVTKPVGSSLMDRGHVALERAKGPAMISFPVKGGTTRDVNEVVLPVGSYVKATLLTGVEAPEANPYPVLLQLDFANILPNNKVLDLRGCFMVAKAQGDLSTERVQMQATKLSCVSRTGQMFERDINGFVADGADNSFAVTGAVNGKQDRVAAMAFLSSVVEGVGSAIQMAQTSEQTSAEGHSRRTITGDQGKYIAYGGASNAAGMVAQWYLKQAQHLLPTINVGSGQSVWVVMNETVALPQEYFKKVALGESHEKDQSIVNRLLD